MVTLILHCSHCGSDALVRDGHAPTASRSIAVTPAAVAAARILFPMPIHKLVARRFCTPTKNEVAYVASPARLGSLAQPCRVGWVYEIVVMTQATRWKRGCQNASKVPLSRAVRKASKASRPAGVHRIPERFILVLTTVLQAASAMPLPMCIPCARKTG